MALISGICALSPEMRFFAEILAVQSEAFKRRRVQASIAGQARLPVGFLVEAWHTPVGNQNDDDFR